MRAVLGAQRRLLEKRGRHPYAEVVGGAAVFLHAEGRARLEIDRAAEGIRALVGRLPLDQLHALKHCAGDRLEFKAPVGAERRERAAVHGDVIQRRIHAADVETIREAFVRRAARHAREAHHHFARAHVRQITKRVHRDHVLHVVGIFFLRDHRRVALALARHLERAELVDARRELEVAHRTLARADDDLHPRTVEADVGHGHVVGAGRHVGDGVAAGIVGQHVHPQRRHRHCRAFQRVARRGVADRTHDRAGRIRRLHGERRKQHQGNKRRPRGARPKGSGQGEQPGGRPIRIHGQFWGNDATPHSFRGDGKHDGVSRG